MMGTYVTVLAAGIGNESVQAVEAALDRMEEVDEKFHALNPASPLHAFNREGSPVADPEILHVVRAAQGISRKTDGAFDVTVAPLVDLWGFFGESPRLPNRLEVEDCLRRVGYGSLVIDDDRLWSRDDATSIDLGAIAKGYAVGQAAETLRAHGVTSALIDAGGDVYALGRRDGELWKVGIRHPRGEDLLGYVEVEDLAVMGSGDYERFFIEDGARYHHIIDPKTGYPATELSGIFVTCPDPMMADAWATALFVLGPDRALEIVEREPGLEAIMITVDGEPVISSGFGTALRAMPETK
jgi:thiamine biosynthesis lipoprotein